MRYFFLAFLLVHSSWATPKQVALYVALCDNASQGIIPVSARIGDGNNPAANLYWGCSDGFAGCFKASKLWKLQRQEKPDDPRILERLIYRDAAGDVEITAEAWQGSEIAACLKAFEAALVSGKHDLCAYIGHNVLMDGAIAPPAAKASQPCDAIVLCCRSQVYFQDRLEKLGVKPVLLTSQLMYPGSFLLRDCLPLWVKGKSTAVIRDQAAASYARNQGISKKAASGVFAVLKVE
jgi:hypothetical protein